MIKYIDLKQYTAIGECGMFSHLYQWMETGVLDPLKRHLILVRAFDVEAMIWIGKLWNDTTPKKIINCNIKVDYKELTDFLGNIKLIYHFKDFIKGHAYEDMFKDFEVSEE